MNQLTLNFDETDEIDQEDLYVATNMLDRIVSKVKEKPTLVDKLFDNQLKMIRALNKGIASAQKKADSINTDVSGNWTPKRAREAESRRKTKDGLERRIMALKRLRRDWERGETKHVVSKIKPVNDIDVIYHWGYPSDLDGTEYDHYVEKWTKQRKSCHRLGIMDKHDNEQAFAILVSYMTVEISPEEQAKRDLDAAIEKLRGTNIPGFFPTPIKLIHLMLDYAQMFEKRGMSVLEPSAGIGNIVDEVVALDYEHRIDCVEVNYTLAEILKMKRYNTSCEDILECKEVTGGLWDRILMNPPFEKGQDLKHIMHCYNTFLKDGGILVSVASNGVMSNTQKKYKVFRELVANHGKFVTLHSPQFNGSDAFRNTAVNTCLVVLRK
jgi:hypothetical protein